MVALWIFPHLHRLFYSITIPVLMLGLGGFMFGGRALFGGQVTLFKGLNQMKRLAWDQSLSVAALMIAATSGCRGGRIFPAVFVGSALRLVLHQQFLPCRQRSPCRAPSWGGCWQSRATAGSAC